MLLDGTSLDDSSSTDPIVLDPAHPVHIDLRVTNTGNTELEVRAVRLEGTVAGLPLFDYETGLSISVPPGSTVNRGYDLDLAALGGQVTGLLPASVQLLDADRSVVASQRTVVDVRGSVGSVYALWGLVAAALCGFQLVRLGLAVARHRLPANRWQRGVRFASLGITAGMLAVFGLSMLRIVAPHGSIWIPVVGGSTLAMFLLGYVSPFLDEEDEDEDQDEFDALVGTPVGPMVAPDSGAGDGRAEEVLADLDEVNQVDEVDPRATNKVDICLEHPAVSSAGRR